ncbi:MAG: peptidylprolyl isomerase [Candidatus Krumholzibacteriia bacterium]
MTVRRVNPRAGRPAPAVRLLLLALFALVASLGGGCSRPPEKNVVATVGPKQVTQAYYERKLAKLKENELPRDAQGQIVDTATHAGRLAFLDVIINKELMALKAEDLGLGADQQITLGAKALQEYAATNVMNSDLFEKPGAQVSDAELAEYYANLGTKRKCSFIICNFREDADKARQAIVSGKPWEDVADEYNDGSRGPNNDYTLDVQWGRMDDAFERAIWSLKEGEISQPILTVYGYWLLRVDRIEPVRVQPLEGPFKEKVLDSIRARKMGLARRAFFDESRKKHDFKLDETGLWIVYQGLPENEVIIDPATNKPTPREQLKPLNVPLADLDKFLYQVRIGDKLQTWTVGDYKQFYDKMNVFERPKRNELLGGLRGNLTQLVERQLLTDEARTRGFLDDPRVAAIVSEQREQMLVTRLHDQVVPTDVPVSPEELEKYWRENRARFDLPERRYGKIILCASEQVADKARNDAAAGMSWDDLLTRYSSDQTNKQNRGNFGPFGANAESPLVKPIFAVTPGQLSPVFKFDQSWAVVRVDSVAAARPRELSEAASEVGQVLRVRHQEEKLQQLLAEWRKQFPVKIYDRRLDKARSWAELAALPPAANPLGKPMVR